MDFPENADLLIAIYVTRERKRAFYNPLTERRKFSSTRKCFADRDSEGTRLRFLSESRSAKQFRELENILLRARGYEMLRFLSRVTYSILSSS